MNVIEASEHLRDLFGPDAGVSIAWDSQPMAVRRTDASAVIEPAYRKLLLSWDDPRVKRAHLTVTAPDVAQCLRVATDTIALFRGLYGDERTFTMGGTR